MINSILFRCSLFIFLTLSKLNAKRKKKNNIIAPFDIDKKISITQTAITYLSSLYLHPYFAFKNSPINTAKTSDPK